MNETFTYAYRVPELFTVDLRNVTSPPVDVKFLIVWRESPGEAILLLGGPALHCNGAGLASDHHSPHLSLILCQVCILPQVSSAGFQLGRCDIAQQ